MFKKIFITLFLGIFLLFPGIVSGQENSVNLYFFWSKTCPHCEKEAEFLQKIAPVYPNLNIYDFEISERNSQLILQKIAKELNIETGGVPITIIGDSHFVGYFNDEVTGQTITGLIEKYEKEGDPNPVGKILGKEVESPVNTEVTEKTINIPNEISVPLLGNIKTKNLSLPVLTIVLGALDGFNPCAMWTLLFLISLLLGMKDKKRRWILGTTFIMASAFVYFLFMAAWLNILLFIGFIVWVRILISLVALGGGGYYLKEYFTNKDSGCKVTGGEKRQAVFEKLKNITHRKQLVLALGGIILLAFAVNLVELICSAGLPVVFTQILTLSNLSTWQYYAYMLLYIFIFMLDDLFIFFTAMITLEMTGISTKYSRISHLVGGILMIIIGFLLLLRPELLMFG